MYTTDQYWGTWPSDLCLKMPLMQTVLEFYGSQYEYEILNISVKMPHICVRNFVHARYVRSYPVHLLVAKIPLSFKPVTPLLCCYDSK